MKNNITFGDMAQALDNLKKKYGLFYSPSENEILQEARRNKCPNAKYAKRKPETNTMKKT